ncbi:MAG: hypothetical protein KDD61_03025, partial [Bdellovibrionales bacterium]|nr:hypothetical protein [Bdellovibrionales bacterium]
MLCSCGNELDYSQCCEPVIRGKLPAQTAEQLMRSRYSAFAHNEMDYVESSHHPKTRKDLDMDGNRKWAKNAEWLGLEIVDVSAGSETDKTGIVEFKAKYKINGKATTHHERSEFRKEKGTWYFYDGEDLNNVTYVREAPKVGRNEPC